MEIADILRRRVIAVVGISRDPTKEAHAVPKYLREHGYRIVPVNPLADELLGERCYPSLAEIPPEVARSIDIVQLFRPSDQVMPHVEQAIAMRRRFGKPDVIWMQLGIANEEAARKARAAGIEVVMDRCMRTEHQMHAAKELKA